MAASSGVSPSLLMKGDKRPIFAQNSIAGDVEAGVARLWSCSKQNIKAFLE